jgi:predicted Fe-Mo cluster-binding NifX family protein
VTEVKFFQFIILIRGRIMIRIAVAADGERVSLSFEKAPSYVIYSVSGKHIDWKTSLDADDNIPRRLFLENVDAVLCGSIGNLERRDLALAGIALFAGVYGRIDDAVRKMLGDTLDSMPDTMRGSFGAHYSPCSRNDEF